MRFVGVHTLHPYRSIATARKNRFILLEGPDFRLIDNLPKAVHTDRRMLTSVSVELKLLSS